MKLDYSAKLFIMTFLLVTFGAQQDSESSCSCSPCGIRTSALSLGCGLRCSSVARAASPHTPRVDNVLLVADGLLVMVTRILGICSGVLLSLIVSVIVFPRSATHVSLSACSRVPQAARFTR
jgi:hypothetical protein